MCLWHEKEFALKTERHKLKSLYFQAERIANSWRRQIKTNNKQTATKVQREWERSALLEKKKNAATNLLAKNVNRLNHQRRSRKRKENHLSPNRTCEIMRNRLFGSKQKHKKKKTSAKQQSFVYLALAQKELFCAADPFHEGDAHVVQIAGA